MDTIKHYSRRSFLAIVLFMVLLVGMIAAAVYYGTNFFSQKMIALVTPEVTPSELISQISMLHNTYGLYLIFMAAGIFFLVGIMLWVVLRSIVKNIAAPPVPTSSPAPKKAQQAPQPKDEMKPHQDQRLFLHLLTVLQKEGRLVDFFQEDLEMYEDEQIGAAVRSIHTSCRKTLDKSLAMTSVIEDNEGDEITIEAGFNPEAIKLTGRVTGEPPFTGIVRHKGWRAQKVALPDLAAAKDPTIISPAEVEIE
jgi:hypothetical protein